MPQYAGRGGWRLRVNTGVDLIDLTPERLDILVKNISTGDETTLTASVESPAANGIAFVDIANADFPTAGAYVLQSDVQRSTDDDPLPLGESSQIEIHEPFQ